MFNRLAYKTKAKQVLKGNYWVYFLAVLVCSFFTNANPAVSNASQQSNGAGVQLKMFLGSFSFSNILTNAIELFWIWTPIVLIVAVISIVVGIFIVNSFLVGQAKFTLDAREGNYNFSDVIYAFTSGHLTNVVKTMFMRDLFITLWTFCFIIPGIVKGYEYYYVPYILAEDPSIDYHDALALSSSLTNGIKMDLFVMNLSFFLWNCLTLITFGLSQFFVAPYVQATIAESYIATTHPEYYNNGEFEDIIDHSKDYYM